MSNYFRFACPLQAPLISRNVGIWAALQLSYAYWMAASSGVMSALHFAAVHDVRFHVGNQRISGLVMLKLSCSAFGGNKGVAAVKDP
jgi:hypothetical protein